jgi:hypothetical protein
MTPRPRRLNVATLRAEWGTDQFEVVDPVDVGPSRELRVALRRSGDRVASAVGRLVDRRRRVCHRSSSLRRDARASAGGAKVTWGVVLHEC